MFGRECLGVLIWPGPGQRAGRLCGVSKNPNCARPTKKGRPSRIGKRRRGRVQVEGSAGGGRKALFVPFLFLSETRGEVDSFLYVQM